MLINTILRCFSKISFPKLKMIIVVIFHKRTTAKKQYFSVFLLVDQMATAVSSSPREEPVREQIKFHQCNESQRKNRYSINMSFLPLLEDFIHLQIIEIHDTAAGYFGSIMGVVPLDYDHVLDTICILNSF